MLPDFKTCYEATVIRAQCYGQRGGQMDQQDGVKDVDVDHAYRGI